MDRTLTEQEKQWLIHALSTLKTGEYWGGGNWVKVETGDVKPLDEFIDPRPFLTQVDGLRVITMCNCNDERCHTVTFERRGQGKRVTIVAYSTEDGRNLIIDVDKDTGELAGLEVI